MDYLNKLAKFEIVNKEGQSVPFILNDFQKRYLDAMTNKDVILKARQIGYSSLILGIFTLDFLLVENSRNVCISHDAPSATKLLDRVKYFLNSAKQKGLDLTLKYNSRNEMFFADKNSTFYIGASGSKAFGRGDTLTNLHLSEFAFYDDPQAILGSVMQAVVPTGRVIIESTANGMNFFKEFWDKSKNNETGFKTHFFDNSFYSKEFLDQKKKELGDKYPQEYPESDIDAFLSSGRPFFDIPALKQYLANISDPIVKYDTHYDLLI